MFPEEEDVAQKWERGWPWWKVVEGAGMADEHEDCEDGDDGYDENWKRCSFHFEHTQRMAEAEDDPTHAQVTNPWLPLIYSTSFISFSLLILI